MRRYARWIAAVLVSGLTGCADMQPTLAEWGWTGDTADRPFVLACHGDFGQFAHGFMVARPMQLDFVVDWRVPSVTPTNGSGGPGRVIALDALELSFEIPYEGYRAAYRLDRVGGTFTQRPSLGGVFTGRCERLPLTTRI